MSHKTGKRVLTASTSLALAVVGLAASPVVAHAAAGDVVLKNNCGVTDTITVPGGSGTYVTRDGAGAALQTINSSAGGTLNADGTRTYTLTNANYVPDATVSGAYGGLVPGFAIFDGAGTPVSASTVTAAGLIGSQCAVPSVPPVKVDVANNKFTITKGVGIEWTVKVLSPDGVTDHADLLSGPASMSSAAGHTTAPVAQAVTWNSASTSASTATFEVTDVDGDATVTVTASPAAGYYGSDVTTDLVFDNQTQVSYVAPKVVDLDGTGSDGVQITPIEGVTWYYSTNQSADLTDFADDGNGNWVTSANGWTPVDTSSGESFIPRGALATGSFLQVAAATNADYKFGNTGVAINATTGDHVRGSVDTITFNDTSEVTAIPEPTFNDGPGTEDYYTLPAVAGIDWVVTGDPAYPLGRTVKSTELGLLNTPIRVIKSPAGAFTVTITATQDATHTIKAGVNAGPWSHDFDSRVAVTPVAPQFLDSTGLADDKVTFPLLGAGISSYDYATVAKGATPGGGDWKPVDGAWYGKSVSLLADLKAVYPATEVWVRSNLSSGYVLTADSAGKSAPASWHYYFDNLVNIIPQAPVVSDAQGTSNDTITFPVDTRVTYTMIANGVSKVIPVSDLGKALPASGKVVVKVSPAAGYAIQTDANGKLPADWTYTFTAQDPVTPKAPTPVDKNGRADDTITLWASEGIEWYVNGTRMDPAGYDKPQSTLGQSELKIQARVLDGYALAQGAQTEWTFPYKDVVDVAPTNAAVDNDITSSEPPTAKFTWGADNATSYDVTYHKKLINGSAGPEIDWLMDTTDTSANFVAEAGDEYTVTVVAKNAHGDAEAVSSTVTFEGNGSVLGDVTTGQGTFSTGWNLLGKAQLSGLPYYGDTAALASNGATWTYTVPAGTKSFDLFATVHSLGAKGKIYVNGQSWANFETNPSYWGTVSNPYGYPVRRVQGWDNTKDATITVVQAEGGNLYLALDAYRVNK